ncbi:MAG: class I SAM-dependent methyltransferase [Candidatus Heimdallarchaeota archaeon]|nr:class I SAM-dependent methyltransferase [Candidatus Heimdallarchaeota archaeon]MBY8993207.1 class I SAM-dependent methyltransferase [Candidatus Heimdallarchaeota archaeon]
MKTKTSKEIFDLLLKDALHPFSGWDFSHIKDRIVMEPLTWSYHGEILPFVRTAKSMLDMGTGGGEFLSSLQPLPKETYATEAYEPNVPVAKKTLEPIGVNVVQIYEDNILPFENEHFDLIINRHESYLPSELYRILKQNSMFITQQVGWKDNLELNQRLGYPIEELEYLDWNLKKVAQELEDVGLTIKTKREAFPITRCFDIGAIVYYLKAIPWQIPEFSVEKYENNLWEMHQEILKEGYLDLTSHRMLIVSEKK